ncbi:hypothetical protein PEC301875_30230 [Pectobacterium carotovorum subsp. carotovorum]|nr:hypothetical protein PEC301875_30230 [Pectobacterium carotovorum subsp. carotovorum]
MSFLFLIFGAFNFLNCLFGSERINSGANQTTGFLSCLYGSEHLFFRIEKIAHFLSCLYGNELK